MPFIRFIAIVLAAATVAALAACAIVPPLSDAERAAAGRSARSIEIVGPDGTLTGEARERVVERLRTYRAQSPAIERKLLLSSAYTGAPLTVGNATRILVDTPEVYREIFDAIGKARDHVHLESFVVEELDAGGKLSDLLRRKAREGVQVRVLYDSVGSIKTPPAFFEALRSDGVAVCEFNPVNPLRARLFAVNLRDHRKIVVVDGRVAFTGGVNFQSDERQGSAGTTSRAGSGSSGSSGAWRDTHMRIEGPAVRELQELFLATWEKQRCAALPPRNPYPTAGKRGDAIVSIIGSSPDDSISAMYLTLMASFVYAERSIYVSAAYFVPDPNTIAALKGAAKRGVDVRLLLPGFTDSWLAFHAGRSHYDELLAAGVRLYEYQGPMLHAKTAVVDGVWSTIGSSNVDWRSFCFNDEVNAVIVGAAFGAAMGRIFEHDLAKAVEVTPRQWAARDASERLSEATAVWFQQAL